MKKQLYRLLQAVFLLSCLVLAQQASSFAPKNSIYQIKVYHFKDKSQEDRLDQFLKNAFIPAMHRQGVSKVGVFKPVTNDTAMDKRIYVFMRFKEVEDVFEVADRLEKDNSFQAAGADYINASFDNTAYIRMESIILKAFPGMLSFNVPSFTTPPEERIYELRSYEGPTEKYYKNKVKMFNEGGEIKLFNRLGFNAVFYAEVLSGSRMPNLMYMTTFENKASREEHWKAFSADEEWKKLSAMPEYKNNVSRNETIFLHPTSYSEI